MQASFTMNRVSFLATCALTALLSTAGCGGDGSGSGGSGGTSAGGPVDGPADAHCKATVTVDPAMCMPPTGGAGGAGGATGGMGGMGGHAEEHNEVLYNSEGDDDDCKYHVKWSASEITQNKDVTFTITLTTKADGKGVTGAAPDIEAYLDETHPAPNSDQKPTEKGDGVYDIGPVQFDKTGKWTTKFHFFEDCMDSESSPHGHLGFFVNVP